MPRRGPTSRTDRLDRRGLHRGILTNVRYLAELGARLVVVATAGLVVFATNSCSDSNGPTQTPIPASLTVVSGDAQSGVVGTELANPLVARVLDASNNPVVGQLVNFHVTKGGGTVFAGASLTNSDGVAQERWTLGTVTTDSQTVEARAIDPTTGTALVFGVFHALPLPDAPKTLAVVSGANQTAFTSAPLADSLLVRLLDKYGNVVPGAQVTWNVPANGGSLSRLVDTTTASGYARTKWTLGSVAGGYTVTGTVQATVVASFSATAKPTFGTPTHLVYSVQPSPASIGAVLTPVVKVSVVDSAGNVVQTATNSITISIGSGTAGAVLGGTKTQSAVAGIATFNDLTVDRSGASYTLSAATTGLATSAANSSSFAIYGTASQLMYQVQPATAQPNGTFASAVKVVVADTGGVVVANATNTIAIGIASGTGTAGAILSGTKVVTAIGGVATFAGLAIDKAGTGYTLTATATGLANAVSTPFTVTNPAGAKLVFSVNPSGGTGGSAVSPNVQVSITDNSGTVITDASAVITLTLASGTGTAGATLSGTTSLPTTSGVASFSNISVDKVGAGYVLTANGGGFAATTSSAFNITLGTAARLGFVTVPAQVNTATTATYSVGVQDAGGNLVASATNAVTVAITAGTGSAGAILTGTKTVSAVSGLATFIDLAIDKPGAGYTLAAAAPGLVSATSAPVFIGQGSYPPTQWIFSVSPSNSTPGSPFSPTVSVALADSAGLLLIPTFEQIVTVSIVPGTGTPGAVLTGTTTKQTSNGIATFPGIAVDRAGFGYQLTATRTSGPSIGTTGAGLPGTPSQPFSVSSSAVALAFASAPSSTTGGAAFSPAIRVATADQGGNVITTAAFPVKLSIVPGTGTNGAVLTGTTTVSTSNGTASFGGVAIDKAGTGYQLKATGGGLADLMSAPFNVSVGPAAKLAFVVQPSSASARAPWSPTVQVAVVDAGGNIVTSATNSITVAISGTTAGTLSGTGTVSAVNGIATFPGLSIDVAANYSLSAGATGLAGGTSVSFPVIGIPSALAISSGNNQSAISGGQVAIAPAVKVTDANGNPVAGVTVTFAVASGGGSITGATASSSSSGIATLGSWTLGPTAGANTLTAMATGLAGSPLTFAAEGTLHLSNVSGVTDGLTGVWGSSATNVLAVGGRKILHYDGTSWATVLNDTNPGPSVFAENLNAVSGTSPTDVWAVGYRGIYGFGFGNSSSWFVHGGASQPQVPAYAIFGVWGDSPTNTWAVGERARINHYNGLGDNHWTTVRDSAGQTLNGVWGTSSTNVWTVGATASGSLILHYDGTAWTSVSNPATSSLASVWGNSASDVWAVGAGGTILHYTGIAWSSVSSGTTQPLASVYGTSTTDVWAVGANGTVLHFNGTSWSSVPSSTTQSLTGVWPASPTEIWVVGGGGVILHGTP